MLGTAINANGGQAPLLAPSGLLQRRCLEAAFKDARRDPNDVDYVELHATGQLEPQISGSGDEVLNAD